MDKLSDLRDEGMDTDSLYPAGRKEKAESTPQAFLIRDVLLYKRRKGFLNFRLCRLTSEYLSASEYRQQREDYSKDENSGQKTCYPKYCRKKWKYSPAAE